MSRRLAFLIVVLVFGTAAAVVLWPTPRRQAIARVKELNGKFVDESGQDDGPVSVGFIAQPVTDDDLPMLRNIRPLNRVLLDGSKVTDAGLAHLEGIEGLDWVSLWNTAVTDEGMPHLAKIRTLHAIHIRHTRVTDTGLASLQGHPNLEYVNALETRVTEAGVAALRRTTPSVKTVLIGVLPD